MLRVCTTLTRPASHARAKAGGWPVRLGRAAAVLGLSWSMMAFAQGESAALRDLIEQNRLLREQAQVQQRQIDELSARVEQLARGSSAGGPTAAPAGEAPRDRGAKQLILSGYGNFGFYAAESRGKFANEEFRVDEARLFVEAQLSRTAYLAGELILTQRETSDENFHLGEYYLDVENALGGAVADRLVNLRVGRIAIPFGEEYQVRSPLLNPLITHSVTDFWGIDEGVELYGESGRWTYAAAVQNGGVSRLRDYQRDKSLVARVGWNPLPPLHLSASAFRTGKLDRTRDSTSEMWVGNAFFRPIGKAATTRTYQATLAQFDLRWKWKSGALAGAIGTGRYTDDDTSANNRRDFDFYSAQLTQQVAGKLYLAGRYSGLETDRGYFVTGLGSYSEFFLADTLTRRTTRLSVGGGYRFTSAINLKLEYTFEDARRQNGARRPDEDQFGAEVAVQF